MKYKVKTILGVGKKHPVAMTVVVCAAVGTWVFLPYNPNSGMLEHRVEKRLVGTSLFERGILVCSERTAIKALATGIIQDIVETGTRVKKGDFLLRIDTLHPTEESGKAEKEIRTSEVDKALTRKKCEKIRHEEQCKIKLNKTKFEAAKLELKIESKAMTDEDRRLLEIERELSVLDVADAQEEYNYQKHLYDRKFVSATLLDKYERKLKAAVAYREELKVKARLKEKGIPVERRIELERNVIREQAGVDRGQKAMERRLAEIENEIKVIQAKIDLQKFNLEWWKQMIRNSVLSASREGIFKRYEHIDWRSGGKWMEKSPGTRTWAYDIVAEIDNPNRMQVELMVNEADFNRLSKNTKIRVRLPAFPGREFVGKLVSLGGLGRDRFEVAQRGQDDRPTGIAVFNAVVHIESTDVTFHPGMSAMAEFILEPPAERLVIPRQAVHQEAHNMIVYRKALGGKPVSTPVKGRIFNEEYFLVSEGLEPGDVIYLDYHEQEGS